MRITRGIPAAATTPVALTIGNFDGVHLGHRAMLDELARAAQRLKVPSCVMIFEPQPREFFAPDVAPARLTSLREKLELLADSGVDRAHVCRFNYAFAQITAQDFIERVLVHGLGVRWLQVGDDFRFGSRRAGDFVMLKKEAPRLGYEVQALPTVMMEGAVPCAAETSAWRLCWSASFGMRIVTSTTLAAGIGRAGSPNRPAISTLSELIFLRLLLSTIRTPRLTRRL